MTRINISIPISIHTGNSPKRIDASIFSDVSENGVCENNHNHINTYIGLYLIWLKLWLGSQSQACQKKRRNIATVQCTLQLLLGDRITAPLFIGPRARRGEKTSTEPGICCAKGSWRISSGNQVASLMPILITL